MVDLKGILTSFMERMGLDSPPSFDKSVTSISFDDMVVNFHCNEKTGEMTVFMTVAVISDSPEERLALYSKLLRTNNFAQATGGGVLGIDKDETTVVFSRSFLADGVDASQLEWVVEAFLNIGEELRNDLRGSPTPSGKSENQNLSGEALRV